MPISFLCYNVCINAKLLFRGRQSVHSSAWTSFCLGVSTCYALVPVIKCPESWSFHLFGAHSSWGLVFLMALSVTPWFCISSVDGFEDNVIDHHGSRAYHPGENEFTGSISFCLAYDLMRSCISSPFFRFSAHLPDASLIEAGGYNLRHERLGDYKRKGKFGGWRISSFFLPKSCISFLLLCNKLL